MRYLIVLTLLTGCSQTMLLYQRGSGGTPPIQGALNTVASTMTILIDGETYTGEYKAGRTYGVGFGTSGTKTGTAMMSGTSNQYAGLLISPNHKTLRCQFIGALGETGNGVCEHGDGRVFDLLLKP